MLQRVKRNVIHQMKCIKEMPSKLDSYYLFLESPFYTSDESKKITEINCVIGVDNTQPVFKFTVSPSVTVTNGLILYAHNMAHQLMCKIGDWGDMIGFLEYNGFYRIAYINNKLYCFFSYDT